MLLALEAVVLCVVFTLIMLPPLLKNPLTQIMSYPPAIRRRVEELPQYEGVIKQTERKNVALKIVGSLVSVAVLAAVAYVSGARTAGAAFVHVFVLFFAVNMYDLIVLDIIFFCHSKRVVITGTEGMVEEYKDWRFHVKGAVKGVLIGLFVAMLSAGLVGLYNILAG
jgi:hypothetical protein